MIAISISRVSTTEKSKEEIFQESLKKSVACYYRQSLSESIKRGLAAKKKRLSTESGLKT